MVLGILKFDPFDNCVAIGFSNWDFYDKCLSFRVLRFLLYDLGILHIWSDRFKGSSLYLQVLNLPSLTRKCFDFDLSMVKDSSFVLIGIGSCGSQGMS